MTYKRIKVALFSDSRLILDGVRKILEFEKEITIVAEGSGVRELNKCIREHCPDFVFIDNRESLYDIQRIMRSGGIRNSGARVIQFTEGEAAGPGLVNLIEVNQETTSTELVAIIKTGTGGKAVPDDTIIDLSEAPGITKTESKIIKLISAGESNKDIAEKLSITEKTVKAHITSIFEKLHVQNRYQLMVYGKRKKKHIEVNL
jgi:DNA-binding NarL/FixJ family response regulator